MHLSETARQRPDDFAAIESDGTPFPFGRLDDESRRLANVFESNGLQPGDTIAILMPNRARIQVAQWGAQRAGLLFVPVNWHLSTEESVYIVQDCGAKALVTSSELSDLAEQVAVRCPDLAVKLMVGGGTDTFDDFDETLAASSSERPDVEPNGYYMFYSSGTTGRPKGIKPNRPQTPFGEPFPLEQFLSGVYGFGPDSVYLSTGPLYHAAPTGWGLGTQALGGTTVIMDRFDAETCLQLIEKYRVTHAQFVPTMFVRLLKLPDEVRARYDVSSLRAVVHAAAPCPPDVKRKMIDWLGPIVYEYYAGSEGNGFFAVNSEEWLAHPGTVGRPLLGTPHILDDDGNELPTGEVGQIWLECELTFDYHNDPEKTANAHNDKGWSTLGDLGHVDEDGYLYLSDRRTDLILSGGVNIYPREIEDALALHPAVADVAVIGVPDDEMGQRVVAVVQPADGVATGPELEQELIDHVAGAIARFKRPRRMVFADELPRLPSGKILRRVVREQYGKPDS